MKARTLVMGTISGRSGNSLDASPIRILVSVAMVVYKCLTNTANADLANWMNNTNSDLSDFFIGAQVATGGNLNNGASGESYASRGHKTFTCYD